VTARQVPQADRTIFGPRREAATPAGRPPRTTQDRSTKIKAPISEAPIFGVATYGCVVDLFTLVPLLSEEFRKLNGGG
jgi:hypothetical protein